MYLSRLMIQVIISPLVYLHHKAIKLNKKIKTYYNFLAIPALDAGCPSMQSVVL